MKLARIWSCLKCARKHIQKHQPSTCLRCGGTEFKQVRSAPKTK